MSPSGAEYIKQVRSSVTEVDPADVKPLVNNGVAIIDVREGDELASGKLPGATAIPRGFLESRIEATVPDHSQKIVLYCASGARSALAANTLVRDLGYEDVASMRGGITLWKDRGYDVEVPFQFTPEQRQRYSRHFLLGEVGEEGQRKLLEAKVLLLGAGGLGSPTALYLAAAGVGTLGIVDDDEVDVSNLQRQVIHKTSTVGVAKVDSAEAAINELNPDVRVVKYPTRLDASNIMEIIDGYDLIVDGVEQLPDALPAQRRVGAAADPGRQRGDPGLRGPAVGLRALRRAVLPLPVPGAAARRARSVLRRPTASSACCPARWACSRPPRSSSSSSAPGRRSSAGCSCTTRSTPPPPS